MACVVLLWVLIGVAMMCRYSAYHHSHPTLTERLRALEGFKSAAASASKKEL